MSESALDDLLAERRFERRWADVRAVLQKWASLQCRNRNRHGDHEDCLWKLCAILEIEEPTRVET